MLLVDHRERQIGEADLGLEKRVGSHHQGEIAGREPREQVRPPPRPFTVTPLHFQSEENGTSAATPSGEPGWASAIACSVRPPAAGKSAAVEVDAWCERDDLGYGGEPWPRQGHFSDTATSRVSATGTLSSLANGEKTVVVGAITTATPLGTGWAHVFTRTGGVWGLKQPLIAASLAVALDLLEALLSPA